MRLLPVLFLTAATAAAQTALFQPFGTGCTFDNLTLTIGNQGLPQLGATFRITYAGPNHTFDFRQQISWPQLALGFQAQTLALPTSWFPQQPAGCVAEMVPAAMIPSAMNAAGNAFDAFFDMTIPNDPGLIGVTLFGQWLTIHQQCGFAGCGLAAALTSDAAAIVIGL